MSLRVGLGRRRRATYLGPEWVRPSWLERQTDPAASAFVPSGPVPTLTNLTQRNWTTVGTLSADERAIVDPRGLVTPWCDGWSFDWWVGADDRWHFPSRETAVRQHLLENTPVVVTSMRVPSGDVIQRVYAAAGEEACVVVEIENDSPVPVALAISVRPYNPEGIAFVERIELHDTTVRVDGQAAIYLPKLPPQMAASTLETGDVAHAVTSGATTGELPSDLRCDAGLAQAAFVFPLAHRATLRFAVPLATRPMRGSARDLPHAVPPAEVVSRGWKAQTERDVRLALPAGRIADAVEAARRSLLLFHRGSEVSSGPCTQGFSFRAAARLLLALDRFGFHAESAEVIRSFPSRQRADGRFSGGREEPGANGAAVFAMAEHFRLTGDRSVLGNESLVHGLRWIERSPKRRGRRHDRLALEATWSLRGLRDGAELLGAMGDDDAAAQAALAADEFPVAGEVLPESPGGRDDGAAAAALVACAAVGLYRHDHPLVAAAVEEVRQRFVHDRAFFRAFTPTGLDTCLTMQLASVELAAGDRRALDRLQWMVEAASPTWTWPEVIHPQLGGGCAGEGHHGLATADFLNFVRAMLVREEDGDLVLCSMLPDSWRGQDFEVHKLPTHFGSVSFAIRHHGSRPALLWDVELRDGAPSPRRITAPGIDRDWSTSQARGEMLLAAESFS